MEVERSILIGIAGSSGSPRVKQSDCLYSASPSFKADNGVSDGVGDLLAADGEGGLLNLSLSPWLTG